MAVQGVLCPNAPWHSWLGRGTAVLWWLCSQDRGRFGSQDFVA